MKVLVVTLLCALAGCAAGGAIAWPGAIAVSSPLIKTIIPGQTKTTAYSTTQYINAVPTSYAFAAQPQYALHQVPQVSSFAALQPAYYQVAGHQYIPGDNIFYPSAPSFAPVLTPGFPSAPAVPAFPGVSVFPQGPQTEPPSQQAGDADTAIIDSADFNAEQQRQEAESSTPMATQPAAPEPTQPSAPLFPSNTFPNFPTFPQFPQESGQAPSFPQLPQFPQIPGLPQFPQNPPPQEPSQSPPSSFPAPINGDKGLNDEDTISVESA